MPSTLIRVLIVEDQPEIRNEICTLVARHKDFSLVGSCGTVKEACHLVLQTKPDLLLLDIHLPDGLGFDVLKDGSGDYKIIFLTAFEKHAVQAIKHGALDYLLKPIDEEEFSQALSKVHHFFPAGKEQLAVASKYHQDGHQNRLVLRSQDYLQVVEIDKILYLHSDSGYTTFYLDDGRKILVSKIIKEYEDILTEPTFLRPHQSYLVNTSFIDKYSKDGFIHLKSGEQIPVATRRRDAIVDFFNRM